MPAEPPSRARLKLPSWLWGGDPTQLLDGCKYRARPSGDWYSVEPEERYLHQAPDLVRVKTLYGPGVTPRLHELGLLTERVDSPETEAIQHALAKRKAKAESSQALLDVINFERLAMHVTPVADLPERAKYLLDFLRQMPLDSDPDQHPFAGASLHAVEVDPALLYRLKLASIWLRIQQDLRLGTGDLSHLTAEHDQQQAFGSSAGLYNGVYMFDAYIDPLLAAQAPGVWAFSVVRTFGPMVFSFGRCVSGSAGDAAELLQLISTPGATKSTAIEPLPPSASAAATQWWVERLNRLFGVLSDLSVFTDRAGEYVPEKHLEALLTLEQIFRRTTSMQVAHRDSNARRTLLFSVLDSIQRANGWSLDTMFTLSHARGVLSDLEGAIPADAATLLLPMARDAVDSLKQMQDGFFIRNHLKTEDVEMTFSDGSIKSLTPESAVAQYLKVLRNATHGHGGKGKAVDLTAALLAHHDGEVPHDIGLLAYLYLLDLVANPERLRRCLFRGGGR